MLEPETAPPVALAAAVGALRAQAERLAPPAVLLPGWTSAAALDYEALAVRIAITIDRLRAELTDAARALEAG